ncbi:bacillithiol system redox-active protein YtxJ [Bacillus kexueae]|uniref:bacillithiol system redox-active protein YtxJ n=1 Tax=Aeribacillus kexueae TaxID=2078952 RepID=UPI001FAFCB75|nr:bacillithiol system redox-active protein YtxJ [Bacillus kexueae]
MQKVQLHTIEDFQQILQKEQTFLFFKNSTTCPISSKAFSEYDSFLQKNSSIPAYYLHVQHSRELSNYIAEVFQIKHESPQVFLISNQEVVWHTSHWHITEKALAENVVK